MRLLLWGLLQREQLVRPEIALVVARPGTRKNRLGVILDFARRVGVAHAEKHTALRQTLLRRFTREDRRKLGLVDVPAGDDADDLAFAGSPGERGGGGERARSLRHDPSPVGEQP